jgi:hypothetical protein
MRKKTLGHILQHIAQIARKTLKLIDSALSALAHMRLIQMICLWRAVISVIGIFGFLILDGFMLDVTLISLRSDTKK